MGAHPHQIAPCFGFLAAALVGCGNSQGSPQTAAAGGTGQGGSGQAAGHAGTTSSDGAPLLDGIVARKQGSCVVKSSDDAPVQAMGIVDRSLATSYTATLRFDNNSSQRFTIQGLEVRLESLSGEALGEPFSSLTTGFVDPGGVGVANATLLPSKLLAELEPQLLRVWATLISARADGSAAHSQAAPLLVEVCDGCLISYPAEARDTNAAGDDYQCKMGAQAAALTLDGDLPCELGIDFAAPCTLCSDELDVCKSPLNNPGYDL